MATLTIRMVRSFEYRNIKSLVLRDLDLNTLTLADLIVKANEAIQTLPAYATYRTHPFDTMKIYWFPHATKPNNLTINMEEDEKLILREDQYFSSLSSLGIVDETELSYFHGEEYYEFKKNPVCKW